MNNAPAREVFLSIVSDTRYSMLVHPEVSGSISVNLKDVSLSEALESIREIYGYEYKMDGSRVYIEPAGLRTRVFQVNYLIGARQGRSDMRVTAGSSGIANVASTSVLGIAAPAAPSAPAGAPVGPAGTQQGPPSLSPNSAGALGGAGNDATRMSTVQLTTSGRGAYAIYTSSARRGRSTRHFALWCGVCNAMRGTAASRHCSGLTDQCKGGDDAQAKIIDVTLDQAYQPINWAAFLRSPLVFGETGGAQQCGTERPLDREHHGSASSGTSSTFTANPEPVRLALGGVVAGATNARAGVFGLAVQTQNFAALLQLESRDRCGTSQSQGRHAQQSEIRDQPFVTSVTVVPVRHQRVVKPLRLRRS